MELTIKTELITDYIKQNHLTIKEFCKKCKMSPNTYYRIMKGATNINIRIIYNIAVEMNILCKDLIAYI